MLVTLAIAALILLAVFVGVAVLGGLLFLVWQRRRLGSQQDDLLEALLERDERRLRGE